MVQYLYGLVRSEINSRVHITDPNIPIPYATIAAPLTTQLSANG